MDVNIQKYLAFVKTVECGSFTNAAEILSYSQSGISRMINDLEKEWNVSLLERGKGGVKLTSDGLKLLPYAQNVCNEYLKLQMQVSELNGLHSGLIRIGTFSSVATHWLPKVILLLIVTDFQSMPFATILLCFWKKVQRQKYQKYLKNATLPPKSILQHGMTKLLCKWLKAD